MQALKREDFGATRKYTVGTGLNWKVSIIWKINIHQKLKRWLLCDVRIWVGHRRHLMHMWLKRKLQPHADTCMLAKVEIQYGFLNTSADKEGTCLPYICMCWSIKNNQWTSWKTNKELEFRILKSAMNELN